MAELWQTNVWDQRTHFPQDQVVVLPAIKVVEYRVKWVAVWNHKNASMRVVTDNCLFYIYYIYTIHILSLSKNEW